MAGEREPCGCPRDTDGMIRHVEGTCTDPVVARLGWYGRRTVNGQLVNEELTALLRARPVTPDTDVLLYLTPGMRERLEALLEPAGLYLFQIPSEDEMPVFGVGARL